jgi:2',3'-cyclic-nucleotide 2'-phosphodiesterase (5'-nucleotidase family)
MVTVRTAEAAIGNFLADAYAAFLRASEPPVDVAFVNGGFIRGGPIDEQQRFLSEAARLGRLYPPGELTDVDVRGWMPFPNRPALITVSGTQLNLERSVASLPADLRNDQGGWLLHPSGLRMSVDCAGRPQRLKADGSEVEEEGDRVTRIEVGGEILYDEATGVDVLATRSFRVAAADFLIRGEDGHVAFARSVDAHVLPEQTTFPGIVIDHVRAHSPIAPAKDGRLTVVGGCDRPATLP